MANSLGWTIGPPLGGALYTLGGFSLPFFLIGSAPPVILVGILATFPVTPPADANQTAAEAAAAAELKEQEAGLPALARRARRLATPGLLMTAFAASLPGTIFALWDIGFTPFVVETFGFSLTTVGLYFAIGPGMYMLLTSAAGAVVDRVAQKKYLIGLADALTGLCFVSIGPFQEGLPCVGRLKQGCHLPAAQLHANHLGIHLTAIATRAQDRDAAGAARNRVWWDGFVYAVRHSSCHP